MKYLPSRVTGDTGEYYFAYWVTHNFGFPCRLQAIDLGVDAHIEVLDNEQQTTGDIVFVQIKTTGVGASSVSITNDNKDYWKDLNEVAPVVIVLIDVSVAPHVLYFKHLNQELWDSLDSNTIQFTSEDILTSDHKDFISQLPYLDYMKDIEKQMNIMESEYIWFKEHSVVEDDFFDYQETVEQKGTLYLNDVFDSYSDFMFAKDTTEGILSNIGRYPDNIVDALNLLKEKEEYLQVVTIGMIDYYLDRAVNTSREYEEGRHHPSIAEMIGNYIANIDSDSLRILRD
jgi:hypothetical protein